MNKKDIIDQLARKTALPANVVDKAVSTILNSMTEALVDNRRIEIRGFGSFAVKEYEAYEGRNPKTGEPILVPEKKLPVFKVGRGLREKLNKG